jgi:hypothetical protein
LYLKDGDYNNLFSAEEVFYRHGMILILFEGFQKIIYSVPKKRNSCKSIIIALFEG